MKTVVNIEGIVKLYLWLCSAEFLTEFVTGVVTHIITKISSNLFAIPYTCPLWAVHPTGT